MSTGLQTFIPVRIERCLGLRDGDTVEWRLCPDGKIQIEKCAAGSRGKNMTPVQGPPGGLRINPTHDMNLHTGPKGADKAGLDLDGTDSTAIFEKY